MHIALGIILIGHGVAHLAGFVVPWRNVELDDMPHKTTLLAGRLDVGEAGMRIAGVLWLVAALCFAVSGTALIFQVPWWQPCTIAAAAFSLILTVFGWPDSRIGIPINMIILVYLLIGGSLGWLKVLGS